MVIENQIPKTETVYEMKDETPIVVGDQIPTYEEFMKNYKVHDRVNYEDLSSGSVSETRECGPCIINSQLNYDNCHCSSDELDRQLKIIRNKRELEAVERERKEMVISRQEWEETIKFYGEKLQEKEEIICSNDSLYQLDFLKNEIKSLKMETDRPTYLFHNTHGEPLLEKYKRESREWEMKFNSLKEKVSRLLELTPPPRYINREGATIEEVE